MSSYIITCLDYSRLCSRFCIKMSLFKKKIESQNERIYVCFFQMPKETLNWHHRSPTLTLRFTEPLRWFKSGGLCDQGGCISSLPILQSEALEVSIIHAGKFTRAALWEESGPQSAFPLPKWDYEKCCSASQPSLLVQQTDPEQKLYL